MTNTPQTTILRPCLVLAAWMLPALAGCGNDGRAAAALDGSNDPRTDADSTDSAFPDGGAGEDAAETGGDGSDLGDADDMDAPSPLDGDTGVVADTADAVVLLPDQPAGSACAEAVHCEEGLHCSQGVCTPIGSVYVPPGDAILGSEGSSFDCPFDPVTGTACRDGNGNPFAWPPTRFRFTYGLFMDATEVTFAQWYDEAMWRAAGFEPPDVPVLSNDQYPVLNISIESAMAWANVRSRAEGLQECYTLQDCRFVDTNYRQQSVATWDELPANQLVVVGGSSIVADELPFTVLSTLHCGTIDFHGWDCTGYRLPTEFEWEYAGRAGVYGNHVYRTADTEGIVNVGPIAEFGRGDEWCALELESHAVFNAIAWWGCNAEHEQPVGLKAPNAWGLYDMVGNASEWLHVNLSQPPRSTGGVGTFSKLEQRLAQTDGVYVDPMRFERDDPNWSNGRDTQSSLYYYASAGRLRAIGYAGIFERDLVVKTLSEFRVACWCVV